jgi:hypothetical protein
MSYRAFSVARRWLLATGAICAHLLRLWLIAYCVSPAVPVLRAETVTFQLPVERRGHGLSLQQWNPSVGAYESKGLTEDGVTYTVDDGTGLPLPTADSYLLVSGDIYLFGDYYLLDATTGESTPPNVLGSPSFNRTSFLNTPWFNQNEPSTSYFVALPEGRFGHAFSLFAQGVSYSLSTGPLLTYPSTDSEGQLTRVPYGFFEGSVPDRPNGSYFLVDHTAHQQSDPRASTNHNFVSDMTWTAFAGSIPTRLLTIQLSSEEQTHRFVVHTDAGSADWVTPTAGARLQTICGVNQNFWIERMEDGASRSGTMGIEDLSIDWTDFPSYQEPPPPDPPTYYPSYQTVSIQVGENHWDDVIAIHLSGGATVYPTADWSNQGAQIAYDGAGAEYYRYNWVLYTAVIDVNDSPWTIDDSEGHTDLMDGWNPPPQDPYLPGSILVRVGENHWDETINVYLSNGSVVTMSPDWSTEGFQAAYDSLGNEYYRYRHVAYKAEINTYYTWTVRDSGDHTELMDGFNPPTPPHWETIAVEVGEDHWADTIRVTFEGGADVQMAPDWTTLRHRYACDVTGYAYYSYAIVDYTAFIDTNRAYSVANSAGHTDFLDGFNPPPLPSVSAQVGENHWQEAITFHLNDGSTLQGAPDWSSQGYQAQTDADGVEYYRYNWVNYVVTIGVNQAVSWVEGGEGNMNLMDGFNPPPPPGLEQPIQLKIAASRWNHPLEVRTSDGYTYPVSADQMQGFWTEDRTAQSWWVSYYFLNATSESRSGLNWWVHDGTTGDDSPPNTHDLSQWLSPDANVDTDGDGLVDWYETLIGTDANSTDSDHDGMSDVWEITHHFNPASAADAAGNSDHDGLTNLEEFRSHTDPHISDTDGDGVNDGTEVSQGFDPLHWEAVDILAEATMAGRSVTMVESGEQKTFALVESEGTAYAVIPNVLLPGDSWTFQASQAVAHGSRADVATEASARLLWLDFESQTGGVPEREVLVPQNRTGHALGLVQFGSEGAPVVVTSVSQSVGPGGYPRGRATYDPQRPFWIVDFTAGQRAPDQAIDLRISGWTLDETTYPIVSTSFLFDAGYAGYRWTLHYRQPGQVEMMQSLLATASPDGSSITGSVPWGASYWLTRVTDGWQSPSWTFDIFASAPSAVQQVLIGSVPAPQANWTTVEFHVPAGMNMSGAFVEQFDGVRPLTFSGEGSLPDYDSAGTPQFFHYDTYTAVLNGAEHYWLNFNGTSLSQDETWYYNGWTAWDSDGDGLPNAWEIANGLHPYDSTDTHADPDGDEWDNLQEYGLGKNPRVADNYDYDGDGLPNTWESAHNLNAHDASDAHLDPDNDLFDNTQEFALGKDPQVADNPDLDNDGLPNAWEDSNSLNSHDGSDAHTDPDNDGWDNTREFQNGSNPQIADNPDIDSDGLPNTWEEVHSLDPRNPSDAHADPDNDGFDNTQEYLLSQDPWAFNPGGTTTGGGETGGGTTGGGETGGGTTGGGETGGGTTGGGETGGGTTGGGKTGGGTTGGGPQPNMQTVTFNVADGSATDLHAVQGGISIPVAPAGQGVIHDYTADHQPHDFTYQIFTAPLDLNQPFTLQDADVPLSPATDSTATQKWYYFGWTRQNGSRYVNLQIAVTREGNYTFYREGSTMQIREQANGPWQSGGGSYYVRTFCFEPAEEPDSFTDGSGTPGEDGSMTTNIYRFAELPLMPASNVYDHRKYVSDLGWLSGLQISMSRSGHHLTLRQSNGASYPVRQGYSTGDISQLGTEGWYNSYYYFDAGALYVSDFNFWIHDDDTGEDSSPNNTNLTGWFALMPPQQVKSWSDIGPSIKTTWRLNGPGTLQGGFKIERWSEGGDWISLATLAANSALQPGSTDTFRYVDSGFPGGHNYWYRVAYFFGTRRSEWVTGNSVSTGFDLDGDGLFDSYPGDRDGDGASDVEEATSGTDSQFKDNRALKLRVTGFTAP